MLHFELGLIASMRGDIDAARGHLARIGSWRASQNNQLRWTYVACHATIAESAGEFDEALGLLGDTMREIVQIEGPSSQASRIGFPAALGAALSLGRLADVEDLLSLLTDQPRGLVPPYLRAQVARGHGILAARRGEIGVAASHLGSAIEQFGLLGFPYWLASTQSELGAVLIDDHRATEATPLLDAARAAFTRLGASPALQRAGRLLDRGSSLQLGRDR
jgi:hypothetical protein